MARKTSSKSGKVTPLMQQYFRVKAKHPEAILLFRVGDFYETFGEDAVKTSEALGIVLTNRNNGGSQIELAGFPHHALDMYLPRLVKAGYRVAICEQLEKPSPQKKIVKRGVTEIVTPGVAINDQLLEHDKNNFLAAVAYAAKGRMAMALLDISTGEFLVSEGDEQYIDKLLQSFRPSEVLLPRDRQKQFEKQQGDAFHLFGLDDWVFSYDYAREKLLARFEVNSLKGFGIEDLQLAQIAAGAVLHYLETTENRNLQHLTAIRKIRAEQYVWLDRFTIRNLELLYSQHQGGVPLLHILDQTVTPMGGRLLKKWVVLPLTRLANIRARQEVVAYFLESEDEWREELESYLRSMGDLERLISKVPLGKVNPRELVHLRKALEAMLPLRELLLQSHSEELQRLGDTIHLCEALRKRIAEQLVAEPPVNLSKGGVVAEGFHAELDELRYLVSHSKELLVEIRDREAERTGIDKLKIGFNNVFGYYLEVTNKYKGKGLVPEHWIRKQTLTNAERYITEELKELEQKILNAEEKILLLEQQLFDELVFFVADYIQPIQHDASVIARLDVLLAFAKIAQRNRYCRPTLDESLVIDIKEGRHPVIEKQLPIGEEYVPNDIYLDTEEQQILLITGPNMSGKSALLRQTALICLMAQMGSYVPAREARLGLLDRVFTRVGASDNISSGESTFMVEMNETASIMNNISDRSLILLDEIGRGTSTYDGVSIAWSIAEFLHENGMARPKTLFATHYHEMNELGERLPRIKNFNVATREMGNKVLFLRKLKPGGSQHSFGIHVARMAGMPRWIVQRAGEILRQLEENRQTIGEEGEQGVPSTAVHTRNIENPMALQLSIFDTVDETAGRIKSLLTELDLNSMTPIDCMMKLHELKKIVDTEEQS